MMFDRISQGLWWDKAWSLVSGCTPVSPACANCWAARETQMRANHPNNKVRARGEGLIANGHFNGQIRFNMEFLDKPLRTRKSAAWAIWNDLFHESITDYNVLAAFVAMGLTYQHTGQMKDLGNGHSEGIFKPRHTFLVLTKRPARMKSFIERLNKDSRWLEKAGGFIAGILADNTGANWPTNAIFTFSKWLDDGMPGLWLGVTAENQQTADERIPILLQIPAAVRFVSVEPMLGPVDLTKALYRASGEHGGRRNRLNWVICGGESGPNARPMHSDWARGLQSQCQDAGVPFFFKSWGEWFPRDQWEHNPELVLPDDEFAYHDSPKTYVFKDLGDTWPVHRVGKKAAGRLLDGVEYLELPGRHLPPVRGEGERGDGSKHWFDGRGEIACQDQNAPTAEAP